MEMLDTLKSLKKRRKEKKLGTSCSGYLADGRGK
jgi:hypothetical protein